MATLNSTVSFPATSQKPASASSSNLSQKLLIPELNLSIGLIGAVLNILAFLSICSNRKFLRKSAFLTGLVLGNIFSSGYSISNGMHRLLNVLDPQRSLNFTAWDCMMAPFIPTWALIGGDGPSLVILLFGLERLSALALPTWHFRKWKPKWSWVAVGIVYAYVLITVIALWVFVLVTKPFETVSRDCYVHTVIGQNFSVYYYGIQIFCGVAAMVATLTALAAGWYRLTHSHNDSNQARLRKQIKMTKHMLVLAVVDFFLVAVSNIILYLTMLTKIPLNLPSGASNHGAVAYCCNATVCVLAYLLVNKNFRDNFFRFYRIEKCVGVLKGCCKKKSSISPVLFGQQKVLKATGTSTM